MIQKIPYPCLLPQHTISKPPTSSRAGKRGWSWQQPFRDLFHTFFSFPAIHIPGTSRGFSKTRGHLVLLCSESPYEIPKPWAEASFSSRKLLLDLCPFTAFTLWAGFAAAVNPKPGCPLSNSSCHSPPHRKLELTLWDLTRTLSSKMCFGLCYWFLLPHLSVFRMRLSLTTFHLLCRGFKIEMKCTMFFFFSGNFATSCY